MYIFQINVPSRIVNMGMFPISPASVHVKTIGEEHIVVCLI